VYFIRKNIRYLAVLALGLFLNTCVSYKRVELKPEEPIKLEGKVVILHWNRKEIRLDNVVIDNNQLIGTEASDPGYGGKAIQVHIFTYSAGVTYASHLLKYAIPVTAIHKVEVYDLNIGSTVAYNVLGAAAAFGIVMLVILLTKESCPFIYAFNGVSYEFTGEIYSGAIHPPLERHDYLPLPTLQPLNQEYLLEMRNEVHEIQYTNLTELLVFDHPVGAEVLVDKYGEPHTLTALQPPKAAQNFRAESVSAQISGIDSLQYLGDTVTDHYLMDGMILQFDRPLNAKTAKLVVRAKNSFWLDYVYGQFYDLFGNVYHDWFEDQKTAPASRMEKWMRDQGIPLAVYVEKNGAWQFVDYFNIVGPVAYKKDVLSIDLSEMQSSEVKIKLEFGFLFWEIDYLAMDFSADLPVQKNVVSVTSAIDQNHRDVSDLLRQDDAAYQTLAEVGEHVRLKFPVPEMAPNTGRTAILHTKGHYEVLRDPQGVPNLPFLFSFRQPGRFIEFSKQRYLEICEKIVQ
jgi:hypothetical protein